MIALVTGASRGVGRGVALALDAAGATVYVTGRTTAALEETAGEVTARVVAELALEYGFTDEDGAQPRSLRPEFEVVA